MPLVLFVSYSGAFGGAERLLVDFAGSFDGEVCVACPAGRLADEARQAGLRIFPIRARSMRLRGSARGWAAGLSSLAGHAREARTIARNLDPDLVIAWGMRSAIACVLARVHPAPTVFQHNDLLPGGAVGALVRIAAARADRVVTLSQAIAEDLRPGPGWRSAPTVVYPGVDVDSFPEVERVPEPLEVLVLGALVDWKRPDLALEACALARAGGNDIRLRFVGAPFDGDGDELMQRLRLRAALPDLAGAVEFAGSVTDPRPELARAGCLLHCAPHEPFGLAVLEALAAGRPVVVPATDGPAEIAEESCGVLYPPGDAAAAGRALRELLGDPAMAALMGARGRARARERFGREAALTRYAEAVMPLARARPPLAQPTGSPGGLAVLTVTHNSGPWLLSLLASLERHLPGTPVVVVDCASDDDSLDVARTWRGRCPVLAIELGENVGFGRACNRGLQDVREPVTAMLNPDVELLDDSLLALAAEALGRRRPDRPARLLAPLVLTPRGSREDSVHACPGSPADVVRALIPERALPPPFGLRLAPWRASRPREVGWAVGCAVVAATETLRRLGPFDEQIFLYGEDLDLGIRAARDGVPTWFWPSARVLHHRAHSSAAAFGGEPFERLMRARREVVARRLGPGRARLDDLAQVATFASRLVAKTVIGRPSERERRQLDALLRVRREGV